MSRSNMTEMTPLSETRALSHVQSFWFCPKCKIKKEFTDTVPDAAKKAVEHDKKKHKGADTTVFGYQMVNKKES